MTLRAPVRGLSEGSSAASEELVRYVCKVHRLALGQPFVAFDPTCGMEADARLHEGPGERGASRSAHVLEVGPLRASPIVARVPLVVIQAFAKGDKCDAVVRDATELGASAVILTATERTVAKPPPSKMDAREQRFRRIADEAARQSGRGDAPRIAIAPDLASALSEVPPGTAGFVLWEQATTPLGPPLLAALGAQQPIAFVIGPEGGLSEAEVAAAQVNGFEAVSLGPFILRTETAAAAVLGALRVMQSLT